MQNDFSNFNNRKIAIGIDLGTTNSLVAYYDSYAKIINIGNKRMLKSIVGFDKHIIVGEDALNKKGSIHSIKRCMSERSNQSIPINDYQHSTPIEISAHILKKLKLAAEDHLGTAIDSAVITVPAHFDDNARNATKAAASIAGLDVLRLINEPTAAALAYGLDNNEPGIYCVYDLGGGTFDVSILRFKKGVFQVLATGGDINLGGDDFDHAISEYLQLDLSDNSSLLKAREIKEHLTNSNQWNGQINNHNASLDLDSFNNLIVKFVSQTISIFKDVIKDANIKIHDIKDVILVGGSSRIPLVKSMITDLIGKSPLDHINPDEIVALGAAISSYNLTVGSNNLLLDVTPLTLGIELMGGIREAIIPRNTPIPTKITKNYTTQKDNQKNIKIHVLQGESEQMSGCRSLAVFELCDLPPMNAGQLRIEVTFQIDADGLLTVTARDLKTGIAQVVEIKPAYGLKDDDILNLLKL